jgi:hypothetical protein
MEGVLMFSGLQKKESESESESEREKKIRQALGKRIAKIYRHRTHQPTNSSVI